jgi:hypothetical protein
MVAAARREPRENWQQCAAVACSVSGDDAEVALAGGGTLKARRATSCLVAPEQGDRVLVAWCGPEAYVLAVLQRAEGAPVRWIARGDTELWVDGALSVVSRTLSLHSARARIDLGTVEALLGKVEAVAERVLQRVKSSYRFVEGADHVRAGSVDIAAESTMSLHSNDTLMSAERLVKVDAGQIQLG